MPYIRAAASIAVGIISGAGAAVPASIAGVYIARACLPGPISGEIVMGLLFLGGLGGVMFGLPCGTIGWFSCSAAMQRGWVLSVTLAVVIAVVVAASGTAVLYWLLIAPRATVPEHSVLIAGIALTIGVGASGAVSALASSAIGLSWRSKLTNRIAVKLLLIFRNEGSPSDRWKRRFRRRSNRSQCSSRN